MKKIIIAAIILVAVISETEAQQNIQLDKSVSITNISNTKNIKKVTVKVLDDDGIMSKGSKWKISHELSYWGIKCKTKESIYYGYEMYGENNKIVDKYYLPQAFNSWIKININDKTDFAKILYDNVCR